jgi:protein-tyrosine phosphatase
MTASHVAPHCAWEACYSIRDLGGYPTHDGSQTRWRALVRADDLSRLTPIGRRALLAYRIRTIVDLRSPAEVAHAAHPFDHNEPGMPALTYQHVPFIDPTDTTVDRALSTVMPLPDIYRLFLLYCPTQIGMILHTIAHAVPGGVLVHCTAGKDRTGLVVALALALAGVADEQFVADYALSDQYL